MYISGDHTGPWQVRIQKIGLRKEKDRLTRKPEKQGVKKGNWEMGKGKEEI